MHDQNELGETGWGEDLPYTLPSFGYLYQCYREAAGAGDRPITTTLNIERSLALMMPDIILLGDMHLVSLWQLCRALSYEGVGGFVVRYKETYGRPDDFNPNESTPRTRWPEKILLYDTIMRRLLAYSLKAATNSEAPILKLLQEVYGKFKLGIKSINRGEAPFGTNSDTKEVLGPMFRHRLEGITSAPS